MFAKVIFILTVAVLLRLICYLCGATTIGDKGAVLLAVKGKCIFIFHLIVCVTTITMITDLFRHVQECPRADCVIFTLFIISVFCASLVASLEGIAILYSLEDESSEGIVSACFTECTITLPERIRCGSIGELTGNPSIGYADTFTIVGYDNTELAIYQSQGYSCFQVRYYVASNRIISIAPVDVVDEAIVNSFIQYTDGTRRYS